MAANLFSIKCRKVPGGTLFTYWATPAEDYLLFPKDDLAFVGDAGRPFELFPGGPELERDEWLKLLLEPTTGAAGPFRFLQDGSWRVLAHPDHGAMLRWREKKRIYTTRYKKKIFEPRRDPTVKKRPLHELTAYWEQHDFR